MQLTYDFRIIGTQAINRALGSVERRFIQHNRRMQRVAGGPVRGARRSPEQQASKAGAAQRREQSKTHNQAMANLRKEEQGRAAFDRRSAARARKRHRQRRLDLIKNIKAERAMTTRSRAAFGRRVVGIGGRSLAGTVGAVTRFGAMGLAIGGGSLVGSALSGRMSEDRAAAQLANKAFGLHGDRRTRRELKEDILTRSRKKGIESGLGTEAVLQAVRLATGKSGQIEMGFGTLDTMTDIVTAYGGQIEEVGRATGFMLDAMRGRYDLSDLKQRAQAMEDVNNILLDLTGQAKVGSIEFEELSVEMGKMAAATTGFVGNFPDLISQLSALGQVAASGGAKNAAEATTALMMLSQDVASKSERVKQFTGIEVFTDPVSQGGKNTMIRDPTDLIFDIIRGGEGNLAKLGKIFGRRSMKVLRSILAKTAIEGGGEKGLAKAREMVDAFRKEAVSKDELRTAAAFVREQESFQVDMAIADAKNQLGRELLPIIPDLVTAGKKMIPALVEVSKMFVDFVSFAAESPWQALFRVMGIKMVADLTAAGIGTMVGKAITSLIAGQAGGQAAGGFLSNLGGKGGKGLLTGLLTRLGLPGLVLGAGVATGIGLKSTAKIPGMFEGAEAANRAATALGGVPLSSLDTEQLKRIQADFAARRTAIGEDPLLAVAGAIPGGAAKALSVAGAGLGLGGLGGIGEIQEANATALANLDEAQEKLAEIMRSIEQNTKGTTVQQVHVTNPDEIGRADGVTKPDPNRGNAEPPGGP